MSLRGRLCAGAPRRSEPFAAVPAENVAGADPAALHAVIEDEIGQVFAEVLACAGVYKCTEEGREALRRFLKEGG